MDHVAENLDTIGIVLLCLKALVDVIKGAFVKK